MIRRHMFTNKFFVLKSNLSYSSLEFVRHYSILKWWTLPWFISSVNIYLKRRPDSMDLTEPSICICYINQPAYACMEKFDLRLLGFNYLSRFVLIFDDVCRDKFVAIGKYVDRPMGFLSVSDCCKELNIPRSSCAPVCVSTLRSFADLDESYVYFYDSSNMRSIFMIFDVSNHEDFYTKFYNGYNFDRSYPIWVIEVCMVKLPENFWVHMNFNRVYNYNNFDVWWYNLADHPDLVSEERLIGRAAGYMVLETGEVKEYKRSEEGYSRSMVAPREEAGWDAQLRWVERMAWKEGGAPELERFKAEAGKEMVVQGWVLLEDIRGVGWKDMLHDRFFKTLISYGVSGVRADVGFISRKLRKISRFYFWKQDLFIRISLLHLFYFFNYSFRFSEDVVLSFVSIGRIHKYCDYTVYYMVVYGILCLLFSNEFAFYVFSAGRIVKNLNGIKLVNSFVYDVFLSNVLGNAKSCMLIFDILKLMTVSKKCCNYWKSNMLFKVMCEEYDREMVMDSVFFEVVDKINFEKLHCLDNDMVDLFKSARGGETRGVLEFVNQLGLLFSKKLDGEVGIVLDLFNEVFKKILFETGESLFMLNVIVKERKVNKKLDAFSLYMIIFCCTVDVFCVRHVDIYKVNRIWYEFEYKNMVAACGLFLMDVLDVSFVRLAHNNLTFLKDMNEIKNVVRWYECYSCFIENWLRVIDKFSRNLRIEYVTPDVELIDVETLN